MTAQIMLDVSPHIAAAGIDRKGQDQTDDVESQETQSVAEKVGQIPRRQDDVEDMADDHGKQCFQDSRQDRSDEDHGQQPSVIAITG